MITSLLLAVACLILGWLFGARWRTGRPAQLTPSDAGRALGARRRAELEQRKREMTRRLQQEVRARRE